MKNLNKKGGFTLIELLVVVLIIGILSSIALPQYTKAVEKARATEAMAWLSDYITAQNVYHMATGSFSSDENGADLDLGLPNNSILKNFNRTFGDGKATLSRKDSTQKKYDLVATMAYDETTGTVKAKRECNNASAGSDICPTITNGVKCGDFSDAAETSWCYTAAS